MWHNLHVTPLVVAEVISLASVVTTLAGLLPPLAALGAVVWYVMQAISWLRNEGWKKRK